MKFQSFLGDIIVFGGKWKVPIIVAREFKLDNGELVQKYSVDLLEIEQVGNDKPDVLNYDGRVLIGGGILNYSDGEQVVEFGFSEIPKLKKEDNTKQSDDSLSSLLHQSPGSTNKPASATSSLPKTQGTFLRDISVGGEVRNKEILY